MPVGEFVEPVIELMVALLIGSVLSLAVFGMMATFEGRRRTLGSTADLQQHDCAIPTTM